MLLKGLLVLEGAGDAAGVRHLLATRYGSHRVDIIAVSSLLFNTIQGDHVGLILPIVVDHVVPVVAILNVTSRASISRSASLLRHMHGGP